MSINMMLRLAVIPCLAGIVACSTTDKSVNKAPEAYFKEAEDLSARGRHEDAITQWKKVKESYRSPELTAMAELKIADAYFANKSYIEASSAYEDFRKLHPNSDKSPYALYRIGLSYYNQIEGIDTDQAPVKNAATSFETFLKYYPQSEYAQDARDRLADCRTKMAQYELYVGRFYYRTDKYISAVGRLEGLLANFPNVPVTDEALFYLGASYRQVGELVKSKNAFNRLIKEYPASTYSKKARTLLEKL